VKAVKGLFFAVLDAAFRYRNFGARVLVRGLSDELSAQHILASAAISIHDSPGKPDDFLLSLAGPLIGQCRREDLPLLRERGAPEWVFSWPGEHYRLLASIVSLLQPKTIVEIGTSTGLSALSMLPRSPREGRIWTFDIVPWNRMRDGIGLQNGSFLSESDFSNGRLCQIIADLGSEAAFLEHEAILCDADLIFVDGPKDGVFEYQLVRNFQRHRLKNTCLLVFDDIRYLTMLALWRSIDRPKLDFTSFGHFAGTGLVRWE